ncbi:hypothetical protein GBAR_LOCUS7786 [Geodia barretti]|uniref:Uncharacterized protein n=1 Tax=Geodia barretti TaxID=519541 RepID=A0AA35RK00_GEOBA|nr:hypothetical protein GBAR_LOCUS7786 [Geodia barretti]
MTSPQRHRLRQSRPRPPAIATTTSTIPTVELLPPVDEMALTSLTITTFSQGRVSCVIPN